MRIKILIGKQSKTEKKMKPSDIISIVSLIFTSIAVCAGGIFALAQWSKGNRIKRAEFFNQIIEKLYFNKDTIEAMYYILYNKDWYTKDFHKNKDIENKIDAFFSYLTYICYLSENNIISKKEFKILQYEINSICYSRGTQTYLWRHYNFSKRTNKSYAFSNLINYLKNNILNDKQKAKFNKDPKDFENGDWYF